MAECIFDHIALHIQYQFNKKLAPSQLPFSVFADFYFLFLITFKFKSLVVSFSDMFPFLVYTRQLFLVKDMIRQKFIYSNSIEKVFIEVLYNVIIYLAEAILLLLVSRKALPWSLT